jgi:hypothetical protein
MRLNTLPKNLFSLACNNASNSRWYFPKPRITGIGLQSFELEMFAVQFVVTVELRVV